MKFNVEMIRNFEKRHTFTIEAEDVYDAIMDAYDACDTFDWESVPGYIRHERANVDDEKGNTLFYEDIKE